MGRHEGTIDRRVVVAVSPEMQKLRGLQGELNRFLYSTELSYGLALTASDARLSDPAAQVSKALKGVYASAWYPSNQGRIKYRVRVKQFLDHLGANARHVSRAIIVQWYSHMEAYLEGRVRTLRHSNDSWGPFTESLRLNELLGATVPLPVRTVLQADFCRMIRNLVVHGVPRLPDETTNPDVSDWKNLRIGELRAGGRRQRDAKEVVENAVGYVLGQAVRHQAEANRLGRRENLEHFYSLFSLANLDTLAFQIEEALLPYGSLPAGRINRKTEHVRREDLIIGPCPPPAEGADGEIE